MDEQKSKSPVGEAGVITKNKRPLPSILAGKKQRKTK
jgi:hypothetical protein